ncbi:hypothetical protein QCC17_21490, partial [Klebsiella pneumoniae]|nr:hypothetical protein [Klebsiella pneumoniae]
IVPWIFSDTCRTQIKPARFGDASGVGGGGGGAPPPPPPGPPGGHNPPPGGGGGRGAWTG